MSTPNNKTHDTANVISQEVRREVRRETQRIRNFLHPVHAAYYGPKAALGIRAANAITGFMGSWTFLWVQSAIVACWIVLNVVAWFKHFDPYPFILLNLAFSTQAAYAAPLILMAGNVSAARDRELWENDYDTNQQAYHSIESLEIQVKTLVEQNTAILLESQQLLELLVTEKPELAPQIARRKQLIDNINQKTANTPESTFPPHEAT
jgi:uncharacterized membrane protein